MGRSAAHRPRDAAKSDAGTQFQPLGFGGGRKNPGNGHPLRLARRRHDEEFLRRVSTNIDSLPETNPQQKRQKGLSQTLLKRLMSEMFIELDEGDDLPAVTGTAL
ncbi:hypothetical protein HY633_05425 [Candidatus Uhrbacteria bacterium]|nr:hypothetical protein [Candidatus Uhrbacteria bacterium]